MNSRTATTVMLGIAGIAAVFLSMPQLAPAAKAAPPPFRLEEATIADVQRAIRGRQITAEQLVNLYFKRIAAYNGTCVKGEADPTTGLMLGEIAPIENAGQVNAYMTLNIRGKRSKTDPADNDPKMLDALETARAQDAYFAQTGNFVGPLHGIPIAVKDNYDTVDMRTTAGAAADYANDKPPQDATMVAKLRAAGAIILGKTNLDEYAPAGIGRSTLGGQSCNPYDTKRITGGSSAGSAAAVAANLAICGLGTDTSGSVRYPSSLQALVGMVATQGLVSRAGIVPLTFSRDRGGPMCRTVADTAALLEVLTGDDPRDVITAAAHGRAPVAYSQHTGRTSLAGKRLGVVRDFMIEATIADRDNIRIGNEALADMKSLGATLVDPVDFTGAIAAIMTAYEPGFFTQTFPAAIPSGAKPIDHLAAIAGDPKLLPGGVRGVNLRMLAAMNPRVEARYALDLYFMERGDKKFRSVEDLYATKSFAGENEWLSFALGAQAEKLDTPDAINHTLRIANLQRILYKAMADNNLDALVYVYTTIPAPLVYPSRIAAVFTPRVEPRILKTGTKMSDPELVPGEPSLKTDLDTFRSAGGSWAVNLSPVSGFPAIVVPAGFTRVIYDRVPDANDPQGSRLDGPHPDQIPVAMEFLARPFDEALLFEIASAYEAGTKHRRPPNGFGPIAGE
ncbi:MAG TPA: amidase family protein [Xanthobacteraceae bacterium]|jgi:Asp-tRNA(Asn)/Glu-tRNA(Gln) amidotransferase A subunit family amidase